MAAQSRWTFGSNRTRRSIAGRTRLSHVWAQRRRISPECLSKRCALRHCYGGTLAVSGPRGVSAPFVSRRPAQPRQRRCFLMLHPLEHVRDHQSPLADTPALASCQAPQLGLVTSLSFVRAFSSRLSSLKRRQSVFGNDLLRIRLDQA